MKLCFLALLLLPLLAVGGCAPFNSIGGAISTAAGFSISQSQIDIAESTYGSLAVFEVEYRCRYDNSQAGCVDPRTGAKIQQNDCRAGQGPSLANGFCAQRAVVVRLQQSDKVAQDALDKVQSDFAACKGNAADPTCSGLVAAYNTASTALIAATALATQYGFGSK